MLLYGIANSSFNVNKIRKRIGLKKVDEITIIICEILFVQIKLEFLYKLNLKFLILTFLKRILILDNYQYAI